MDEKQYWYFLRKVHERLTIIFEHKLRNKMELDDSDELILKDLYIAFSNSDLYQTDEVGKIDFRQTEIMSEND